MKRPSTPPVITTEPVERSSSSDRTSSSSSATMVRFMKLCGGLSMRTVRTRPSRSVVIVSGTGPPFGGDSDGGRHRVGDPAVDGDVVAAVDRDLGDHRPLAGEVAQLVEVVDPHVGKTVQRRDPLHRDAGRGGEKGLELVAL